MTSMSTPNLKTASVDILLQKKYILRKDVLLQIASLHKEKLCLLDRCNNKFYVYNNIASKCIK